MSALLTIRFLWVACRAKKPGFKTPLFYRRVLVGVFEKCDSPAVKQSIETFFGPVLYRRAIDAARRRRMAVWSTREGVAR